MKLTEKTVSRTDVYTGRIVTLHVDKAELENGKIVSRECVDHPGGVCVAALTAKNELFFVRQFRYPYGEVVLELPAGKLEPGEDPLEAGKRELREETGVTGSNYVSLGRLYPSPGYTNEVIWLYACSAEARGGDNPDDDEFLEAEKIPLTEAVDKVLAGEIPDAKTQVILLKTAALLERNGGRLPEKKEAAR